MIYLICNFTEIDNIIIIILNFKDTKRNYFKHSLKINFSQQILNYQNDSIKYLRNRNIISN